MARTFRLANIKIQVKFRDQLLAVDMDGSNNKR